MQSSITVRNNGVSKKEKLGGQMKEYIDNVLSLAEREGTMDYFKIEMKNNKGQLHLESTIQNRSTVY